MILNASNGVTKLSPVTSKNKSTEPLGAGSRLLAFDLSRPARLWEDTAELGFWSWSRHADTVLMAAELELAAWDIGGRKLWSTFVEPPWDYTVTDGRVALNIMGDVTSFDLTGGP